MDTRTAIAKKLFLTFCVCRLAKNLFRVFRRYTNEKSDEVSDLSSHLAVGDCRERHTDSHILGR